ncbi:hypothetical protein Q4489_10405 [Thalassotalea sp. 1_MG-2023]|uniref:hypothetical protein n=1 Tax=Thalassotalea sp. 1_MG-2023 TaxID=3062680 RepID=UPI0026E2FA25|nr:hypothetical protein [Thalassotalea sp. 1_MG-2023]MDO6427428.1 hypothetical protein [Thalassotalea sp. 1_MG-2023]
MLEYLLSLDIVVVFVVVFCISYYFFDGRDMLASEWLGFESESSVSDEDLTSKNQEIQQLKQRIETLEKLVTDPQEQLKREIDAL